jgi:hypothetical protein
VPVSLVAAAQVTIAETQQSKFREEIADSGPIYLLL